MALNSFLRRASASKLALPIGVISFVKSRNPIGSQFWRFSTTEAGDDMLGTIESDYSAHLQSSNMKLLSSALLSSAQPAKQYARPLYFSRNFSSNNSFPQNKHVGPRSIRIYTDGSARFDKCINIDTINSSCGGVVWDGYGEYFGGFNVNLFPAGKTIEICETMGVYIGLRYGEASGRKHIQLVMDSMKIFHFINARSKIKDKHYALAEPILHEIWVILDRLKANRVTYELLVYPGGNFCADWMSEQGLNLARDKYFVRFVDHKPTRKNFLKCLRKDLANIRFQQKPKPK